MIRKRDIKQYSSHHQATLYFYQILIQSFCHMALSMRWNTISAVIASTTFLCLQDLTKKGMVLRNFASSLNEDDEGTQKKTAFQMLKQKYQNSKSSIKQIKEKGNGSYLSGLKKTYEEYDQSSMEHPKLQAIMSKYKDSKQFAHKLKQEGNGSYYNGLKKMYKQYKQQKVNKAALATSTSSTTPPPQSPLLQKVTSTKQAIYQKYKTTTDLYKKASQQKSQKLIMKHLYFGGLAICGAILAPRPYLLLNVLYFAAYQVYYFSDVINRQRKYAVLDNLKFQPLWIGFMIGGAGIFGVQVAKVFRSF